MRDIGIVPGAYPSADDQIEILYREIAAHRMADLPDTGGLGRLPLPIRHQHKLPTCTGEAGAYCRTVMHYLETAQVIDFSGLFIYKMNRHFDGLSLDAKGSTVRATMQTLVNHGVCREQLYPSNKKNCQRPFPSKRQGGGLLLADGAQYKIKGYARCKNLDDIILALSDGHPVIFSMIIFTDFYMAENGVVSERITGKKIGGHSMVALNYDLTAERIEVVQSWGDDEKGPTDNGYMYIPFRWFTDRLDSKTPLLIEAFVPL